MKSTRTVSILGIGLALLYLAAAFFSLYTYRYMLQTLASYGVSDAVQLEIPEIAQTRAALMGNFIQLFITGVLVASIAVALFRGARWARHGWLLLVTLLVFIHVVRLVLDFRLGSFFAVERVVGLVLISALAGFSWLVLTRPADVT